MFMKDDLYIILGLILGSLIIGGILLSIRQIVIWLKEGFEIQRAKKQGYRVQLEFGDRGEQLAVWYRTADIEKKFEAKDNQGKWVIDLSVPYAGTFSSYEGYWELMRSRMRSELKRLLGDRVEITD